MSSRFSNLPATLTKGVNQVIRKKKVVPPIKTWKIVRGDEVQVMSGRDKGKQGTVMEVLRKKNAVLVENCKMVNRYERAGPNAQGMMVRRESPIHYSNVALLCPETGEPTRIAFRFTEDGRKIRVSKKSGVEIPRPEVLAQRRKPRREFFDGLFVVVVIAVVAVIRARSARVERRAALTSRMVGRGVVAAAPVLSPNPYSAVYSLPRSSRLSDSHLQQLSSASRTPP